MKLLTEIQVKELHSRLKSSIDFYERKEIDKQQFLVKLVDIITETIEKCL